MRKAARRDDAARRRAASGAAAIERYREAAKRRWIALRPRIRIRAHWVHRLNRAEYANAVRDLLALDVDVSTLLPADDSSEGFDNIADALGVSPALLERYVSAATKISRIAVGDPSISPMTVDVPRSGRSFADWNTSKACRWGRAADFCSLHVSARCGVHVQDPRAEFRSGRRRRRGAARSRNHARRRAHESDGHDRCADLRTEVKAGPHTIGVALKQKNLAGVGRYLCDVRE